MSELFNFDPFILNLTWLMLVRT